MTDIDSALSEINRIRDQLAASTRFQGFTPAVVAFTGSMAIALATLQTFRSDLAENLTLFFAAWILLALICACLIATDAIVRARRLHRAMADTMLNTTLRHFLPVCAAGGIVAFILLTRAPQAAWALPGLWQILVSIGAFAALTNLPRRTVIVAGWYFLCGAVSLTLASGNELASPWMMGLPFGIGQLLAALIFHDACKRGAHG
jgi:hypothetical protein